MMLGGLGTPLGLLVVILAFAQPPMAVVLRRDIGRYLPDFDDSNGQTMMTHLGEARGFGLAAEQSVVLSGSLGSSDEF